MISSRGIVGISLCAALLSGCGKAYDIKADFGNKTAQTIKTVPEAQIQAETEEPVPTELPRLSDQELIINLTPAMYTYEDLIYDMGEIERLCGDHIKCNKLCDTVDGRGVYDIVVGDIDSENQILIFGAMHAREYVTTQIVMRQLCGCIDALNGYGGEYEGIPEKELLEKVTVHFAPMNNPDGVTISQAGFEGLKNEAVRNRAAAMGGDHVQWKANANGVDLNRNFDAGWAEFTGSGKPSAERYKGTSPGCENESAAMIRLTQDYNIKRTISYHTCGALIYWYYKQEGAVLEESRRFAERISAETGYPLDFDYTAVDAAGYKDWAVYKMGVPSITIETGNENGGGIVNPVPMSRFDEMLRRNADVVYAAAYDLLY